MSCTHYEVIDAHGLGTCTRCGQQRQYNLERPNEKPVLVREGGNVSRDTEANKESNATGEPKKKMKMTENLRAELMEVGPEEFSRRHGYSSRAHGIFVQLYRRWGGESVGQPAAATAPADPSGDSTTLEIAIKSHGTGRISGVLHHVNLEELTKLPGVKVTVDLKI